METLELGSSTLETEEITKKLRRAAAEKSKKDMCVRKCRNCHWEGLVNKKARFCPSCEWELSGWEFTYPGGKKLKLSECRTKAELAEKEVQK